MFEDLIEELRDENLLEETVIDVSKPKPGLTSGVQVSVPGTDDTAGEISDESDDERDFFRKRAIDEVSSLQMVEHVLAGIEREQMKTAPLAYDNLQAKKALHKFLQVQSDTASTEYAEAEFQLMHETEAWSSALAERDMKISAASLRRFCENSRPALSSQALIALGRFYRNTAFSELSRAKFDLVMTRLFSKDTGDERRRLLFSRADMVGHLKTLYANWASVALYSADDTSNETRPILAGFEERLAEAESADTFEKLIQNTFFDQVREFKESTGEIFFTPEIVSAAIEFNVRIGNKFVDLIQIERERSNADSVEQRYGYQYDQVISEAAGKTLQLVELLKSLPEPEVDPDAQVKDDAEAPEPARKKERRPFLSSDSFKVNKWLLALTIVVTLASGGLYFWSSQASPEVSSTPMAKSVDLANSGLESYLRSGRASAETFYAITLPAWDELPEDQKREVLRKTIEFAGERKLRRVKLVNVRGDAKAFAAGTRFDIYNPVP